MTDREARDPRRRRCRGTFGGGTGQCRRGRRLDEVCSVALADGATVEKREILTGIRGMPPGMRSSLQKDVWSRVASELDGIGGAIVRIGRQNKIDTPVVRSLSWK